MTINNYDCSIIRFEKLAEEVLYYPPDCTFPLMDMYYKDQNGKLVGNQASRSKKHDQNVATYMSFYEKIGTNPEKILLKLYF